MIAICDRVLPLGSINCINLSSACLWSMPYNNVFYVVIIYAMGLLCSICPALARRLRSLYTVTKANITYQYCTCIYDYSQLKPIHVLDC